IGEVGRIFKGVEVEIDAALPRDRDHCNPVEVECPKLNGNCRAVLERDRERYLFAEKAVKYHGQVATFVQAADEFDCVVVKANLAPRKAGGGQAKPRGSRAHRFNSNRRFTLRTRRLRSTSREKQSGKSGSEAYADYNA